ncbi:MAG TPA: energy transducer TonB, partial [Albitalea sp.]|nr:energy transducer TonB [Albitalea sp.]
MAVSFRTPVLPWATALEDEARFRRILNRVLAAAVLLCLLMLFMPAPQVDRTKPQELPPRLAKLLLEREPLPPPKPIVKETAKAEKAQETPQQSKQEVAKVTPPKREIKGAEVPEARNPQPNKPPGEIGEARRKASGVGLLAMKDQLAEMHAAPVAVQLRQDIKQGPGVGTGVGVGVGAGTEAGLPVRSMITSNAAGGSGGINTAAYSRNTGGGGLAGRSTTLVEGAAGGGGGGGYGGGGQRGVPGGTGSGAGGTLHKGGSGKASRSLEDVRLVFDRNKGAIYAIYNRL